MNIDFKKILKNEPKFRLLQVKQAVFCDLIENWSEARALPKSLQEKLQKEMMLDIKAKIFESDDKQTIKALIELSDGLKIESVLMRYGDRNTICVSSQVGCPLNCSFCATGKLGFKRNLEVGEIVEQVLLFERYLRKEKQRVSNVVFMGMGEPFLNYNNVIQAIRILNDKEGLNIGARKISISTAGIVEGIKKFSQEDFGAHPVRNLARACAPKGPMGRAISNGVNLAISLHASNDKFRKKLMPIAEKYSIAEILEAVDDYIEITNRKVMFEYIMIKDVNDSGERAQELAKLLNKKLYMVNLISYNPTGIFKASSAATIKKFKEILEKQGIEVTQRYKFGKGIKAACGQLVGE